MASTQGDNFRELLAGLEECSEYAERDILLDELLELSHHIHLSREEWFLLGTRLDMIR